MEAVMTDQTYAALVEEVAEAEKQLVVVAGQDEAGKWWDPYELRKKARNGWSPGAMGIALDNLIDRRIFEVNTELHVRLRG
jgi:hypothetical protein